MTDRYFGSGGSNSNGGTSPADAWETFDYARDNSIPGDTLICLDGDVTPQSFFNFSNEVNLKSLNFRSAVFKPTAAGVRTFFISGSLDNSQDPIDISDVVIDSLGLTDRGLDASGSTTCELLRFNNWEVKNWIETGFLLGMEQGHQKIINPKFHGVLPGSAISSIAIANNVFGSRDGDQLIEVIGGDIDLHIPRSGGLVQLQKESAGSNRFEGVVRGLRGKVKIDNTATQYCVRVWGADSAVISDCDLTIDASDGTSGMYGLIASGKDASTITPDCLLSNNRLQFIGELGYGLAIGESTVDSFVTGGLMAGNCVTGRYYESATPHNILLGRGTAGVCEGNVSRNGFIGILASITEPGTVVRGCLVTGNYGSSIYCKGAVDFAAESNTAVIQKGTLQRNLGVLHITSQTGGFTTQAARYESNDVIVQDINDILNTNGGTRGYLARRDTGQSGDFIKNTYYLPDTFDIETELLFHNGATALTFEQWLLEAFVDNDQIVLLPQAELDDMAGHYVSLSDSAAGEGGSGSSNSCIRSVLR